MSFAELLADMGRARNEEPSKKGLPEAQAETLKERLASLQVRHDFKVGDLLQLKPHMGFARDGVEKDPWIVIDTDVSGYPAVHTEPGMKKQRRDIAVAAIDSDGGFFIDLWDSRFFEPYAA